MNRAVSDRSLDHMEMRIAVIILGLTNEQRGIIGRTRLVYRPAIDRIAKAHSEAMLAAGVLAHELNGDGPTDRAMDVGYDCEIHIGDGMYEYGLSENIAYLSGYSDAQGEDGARMLAERFIQRWLNSPEHKENMLDFDSKFIGVGVAGDGNGTWYATQNFAAC